MKIATLCTLFACVACIHCAAASRADLLFGNDEAENAAPTRHLTAAELANYDAVETSADEGAVIVPAPKGAGYKSRRSGRIAYGKPAAKGQFPTVVWLSIGDYICTGTLIAKKAILTAAHCVKTESGAFYQTSDIEVGYGSESYDYTEAYAIDLIVTAKYDRDTNYGDLALLRLKTPIAAKYVPLATTSTRFTKKVDVVGRGEMPGGSSADVMMYTQVSTLSKAQCDVEHEDIFGNLPPAGAICFGLDKNPSTQSCGGDSGGPYFTQGTPKYQVGLVSYGPDIDCGSTVDNLEVATSIPYWQKWIANVMTKYKMK